MWRSTALNLPLELVFPLRGLGLPSIPYLFQTGIGQYKEQLKSKDIFLIKPKINPTKRPACR